jgi:uncharacterized protein (TIGR02246 family)
MQNLTQHSYLEDTMTTTDRDAVLTVLRELVDAWARHDADAFAALFTEDASYTTFVGTQYRGRTDIAESHRTLWAKFIKGTKLADEILDVRFLGSDVAVVTSRGATYKGEKRPAKLDKVQTYTLVRDGGRWLIAAFHNTKHARLKEAISFKFAPETVPSALR